MSFLLHLDTTTTLCSVAISQDNKLITCCEIEGQEHAKELTLLIERACQESNINLKDLSGISLSKGPGSYTSLRIGAATVKGICFALNLPLIAVDSLEALALATKQAYEAAGIDLTDKLIVPMVDARRMDAYCTIYDHELQIVKSIACDTIDEGFLQSFKNKKLIFVGDAAQKYYAQEWAKDYLFELPELSTSLALFTAKNLIPLATAKFEAKAFENIYHFEPFYLKPPAFTAAKNPLSFF